MNERDRAIAEGGQWAVDRLAARIGQAPEPIADEDYGQGHLLHVPTSMSRGDNDARFIGLYPESGVVSIFSKNVDVTIRNATVREARSGIFVETDDQAVRVLFLRDGHIAVEVFPPPISEPLESPTGIPESQNDQIAAEEEITRPRAFGEQIRPFNESSPTPFAQSKEKQPRVRITGRVGADPHFRQSQQSGLVAQFPVAEHVDGQEQPTWHRVYTTGDRAHRLQDKPITKGQRVRVDGYRQERVHQKPDGQTEMREVIYAVHIRSLGEGKSEPAPAGEPQANKAQAGERHAGTGSRAK